MLVSRAFSTIDYPNSLLYDLYKALVDNVPIGLKPIAKLVRKSFQAESFSFGLLSFVLFLVYISAKLVGISPL
jgi:hypothetical protein|nr:MAG TPA: hypothetical protein [Caudoviricetes sp.]